MEDRHDSGAGEELKFVSPWGVIFSVLHQRVGVETATSVIDDKEGPLNGELRCRVIVGVDRQSWSDMERREVVLASIEESDDLFAAVDADVDELIAALDDT